MSTAAPPLVHPERVAAIDLGSNSARVVVVEVEAGGHLEVVEELRTPLRLALALGPDGRLPADAVAATLAALHEFMAVARGAGAQRIEAVATAALRDARNADAILAPARQRLGLTIDVIDAQAEAERSFVGAIYGLPVDHGLLVDIGGGSMEVVHFRDRAVAATWSFPFGVLRMWDQYLADDPPAAADLRRLAAHVSDALRAGRRARPGRTATSWWGRAAACATSPRWTATAVPTPSIACMATRSAPAACKRCWPHSPGGPSTSAACCRA